MKENKSLFFSLIYILRSMFSKTYFMHLLRHTITSPYICSYAGLVLHKSLLVAQFEDEVPGSGEMQQNS